MGTASSGTSISPQCRFGNFRQLEFLPRDAHHLDLYPALFRPHGGIVLPSIPIPIPPRDDRAQSLGLDRDFRECGQPVRGLDRRFTNTLHTQGIQTNRMGRRAVGSSLIDASLISGTADQFNLWADGVHPDAANSFPFAEVTAGLDVTTVAPNRAFGIHPPGLCQGSINH